MPAYVSGLIFTSIYISKKWIRVNTILAIIIHIALAIEVVFYVVPIKSDDTWFGWEELSQNVENIQKEYPNTFIFSADNYKTTAILNFYGNQKVYAQNVIGKFALHFNFIGDDLSKLNGKDGLFIDSDRRIKSDAKSGQIPKELRPYFSAVTEVEPILIKHHGKTVRKFWVYHATNYQNIPKN